MLYRAVVGGIIAFWLVMTALFIRTEWFPEQTDLLPVPVSYVGRLMFRHEQPSDLGLYSQHRRLDGTLHLQPQRKPSHADPAGGPMNVLSLGGNFAFALPNAPAQRVIFNGSLELDADQELRRVELAATFHPQIKSSEPYLSIHLDGDVARDRWHYQVQQGTDHQSENTGTPAELLAGLDLSAYGIRPEALAQLGSQVHPTVAAHRGVLRADREEIESYVVTFHQGDALELTIYFNQLGQILAVKTPLGYDLYDETLLP